MSRTRAITVWAVVALASVAAGAAYHWTQEAEARHARTVVERVYATRLGDLTGSLQHVEQWRGRVLVVNFWATWCAPCREEIPHFVRLQEIHGGRGLLFVGIAIDQPEKVAPFARDFQINYPVLVGGLGSLDLLRQVGNKAGVLPYTVVIDRQGRLAGQKLGGIKREELETLLNPLL